MHNILDLHEPGFLHLVRAHILAKQYRSYSPLGLNHDVQPRLSLSHALVHDLGHDQGLSHALVHDISHDQALDHVLAPEETNYKILTSACSLLF